MLSEHQAVEIYMHKIDLATAARYRDEKMTPALILLRRESKGMAKRYGLTIRAIQDIWNRRSWAYATHHLWALEDNDQDDGRKKSTMSAAEVRNHN